MNDTSPEAIERLSVNDRELIALLIREGNYSGVWFAEHLLRAAALIAALAAERDAANVKQLTEADFRIAYQGHGRAIRRDQDEPYPSEPYMSMDDAARLSAELVAAQPGIDPQEVKVPRADLLAIRDALEFYADPGTYHACSFRFDRPTGGFDEDFDEDHGDFVYDRPMPGKLARAAIATIEGLLS